MTRLRITRIYSVVLTVVGIAGFIPQLFSSGLLCGVFAADATHNIAYILTGVFGALAVRSRGIRPRQYLKCVGILYFAAALAGIVNGASIFGLTVTNGPDNLVHLLIAAFALWAGFGVREFRA